MKMNRPLRAVVIIALCASAASAQEFRGAITGTVTDTTGAAVAGANIEARDIDTNTVVKTTTNTSGSYVLPFLDIGHYSIFGLRARL